MSRFAGKVVAVTGGAYGIVFLSSHDASYVTGTCLFIDGGQTALSRARCSVMCAAPVVVPVPPFAGAAAPRAVGDMCRARVARGLSASFPEPGFGEIDGHRRSR